MYISEGFLEALFYCLHMETIMITDCMDSLITLSSTTVWEIILLFIEIQSILVSNYDCIIGGNWFLWIQIMWQRTCILIWFSSFMQSRNRACIVGCPCLQWVLPIQFPYCRFSLNDVPKALLFLCLSALSNRKLLLPSTMIYHFYWLRKMNSMFWYKYKKNS